jgi:hypothetical protein
VAGRGGQETDRDWKMADDQLLNEHQQIWKGFVRFITISTVLVIVTLALMALFLL